MVKKALKKRSVTSARQKPVTQRADQSPNLVRRIGNQRREYLKKKPHRSFRLTRKDREPDKRKPLESIRKQVTGTFKLIWQEKKILFGLGLVFAILNIVLLGGVAQGDFLDLKKTAQELSGGSLNAVGSAAVLFLSIMNGTLSPADNQDQYLQFLSVLIITIFWLAVIWALRGRLAGKIVKVRDVLYSCCGPLVASTLVALVIIIQSLPAIVAVYVFGAVQSIGILQSGVEAMMLYVAVGLIVLLSVYWASSSLIALMIVTLPQMYPWAALRVASELVTGRRWALVVRLVVLGIVVYAIWAIVLLPVLLLDGWLRFNWLPLLPVTVLLLSSYTMLYVTTYLYRLYRSML